MIETTAHLDIYPDSGNWYWFGSTTNRGKILHSSFIDIVCKDPGSVFPKKVEVTEGKVGWGKQEAKWVIIL